MRRFIFQTTIFILLVVVSVYLIFLQADGSSDNFYLRFTTDAQSSLILGNSRAAQGIRPDVLNRELQRNDIYNYSFTLTTSRYGEVYLESIKKKLKPESKGGIFILSVDPWSISDRIDLKDTDARSMLATTPVVNIRPNFFYLFRNYDRPYFHLLLKRKSNVFLHDDGWLEVSVKTDSASVNNRIESKVAMYSSYPALNKVSKNRLKYLQNTIQFLKSKGEVYLVRLPVHPRIWDIEMQLSPDFESLMREVAMENGVSFFDFTPLNSQVTFTDGNHLEKSSAAFISKHIGDSIKLTMALAD